MKEKLKDLYNDPYKVDTLLVKAMFIIVLAGTVVGALSILL